MDRNNGNVPHGSSALCGTRSELVGCGVRAGGMAAARPNDQIANSMPILKHEYQAGTIRFHECGRGFKLWSVAEPQAFVPGFGRHNGRYAALATNELRKGAKTRLLHRLAGVSNMASQLR